MNTLLDGTFAWLWFPESAEYKDRELRLVLAEGTVSAETIEVEILAGMTTKGLNTITVTAGARRILVHFEDVRLLHVLDEVAHKGQAGESRENGVVAKHHNSALLRWLEESTKLIQMIPGDLHHYSVETAEDFYHVITCAHPTVSKIEA